MVGKSKETASRLDSEGANPISEKGAASEFSGRSGFFGIAIAKSFVDDPRIQLLSMASIGIMCLLQARTVAGFPTPSKPSAAARILRTGGVRTWKVAMTELLNATPPLIEEVDGFVRALPVGNSAKREVAEKRALAAQKRWEVKPAETTKPTQRKSRSKPVVVAGEVERLVDNVPELIVLPPDSGQQSIPGLEDIPIEAVSGKKRGFARVKPIGCPNEEIYQLFVNTCTELPRVQEVKLWHNQRIQRLGAAWKKYPDIKFWAEFFTSVHESDFLCARAGHDWQADFDWLLKQANFAKVVEGNYKNKGKGRQQLFNSGTSAKAKNYAPTEIPEENEFMQYASQLESQSLESST